jgi:hypothetical protein
MTHTNHPHPVRETAGRTGSPRAARSAARTRHASDFSDAVVAVYIHDISARHRRPRPAGRRPS